MSCYKCGADLPEGRVEGVHDCQMSAEDYEASVKELNGELKTGGEAATALVAHLERMGAAGGKIKVQFGGNQYEVTVRKL